MIYVDSNVFVIASNPEDERRKSAVKLLKKLEETDLKAVTSAMTVDEVVYAVAGIAGEQKALETWKDLHSEPGLKIRDLREETVSAAKKHYPKFDPRDALHLQTFKQSRADHLVTEDKDFLDEKKKAVSIEAHHQS
jgi:predicted nucleic acid-binding protein